MIVIVKSVTFYPLCFRMPSDDRDFYVDDWDNDDLKDMQLWLCDEKCEVVYDKNYNAYDDYDDR